MTENDSTNPVDISDDLEAFENEFYDKKPEEAVEDEAEADDAAETDDDHIATDEDEDAEDPEDKEDAEAEDEDEEEEPEEAPKPKNRKSAKERIEELVAQARVAERERDIERRERQMLVKRLEELEAQTEEKQEEPLRAKLPADAPSPDAVDDKGEPVYPLGEFDPAFIRDLTKFTIAQETAAAKAEAEQEAFEKALEKEQNEIQQAYMSRIEEVEKEIPDLRDGIVNLTDTFKELEPAYGEYLATTLMASEYGPQIMYYLSQNIGEAQRIVASGPAAATLALGRLEASFMKPKAETKSNNTRKVSKAPDPPVDRSRGSGGRFDVAADTDDLDAFEKVFYGKK